MKRQVIKLHSGFSLMEVMVAVLILSVGLLGLAGMQVAGLRSIGNSASYTNAVLAANDLVERMRANPTALANDTFINYDFSAVDCNVAPVPYCIAAECNPTQMAQFDLFTWFCGETPGAGIGSILTLTNLDPNIATPTPGQTPTVITCVDNPDLLADGDPCSPGSAYVINLKWAEVNQNLDGVGATIVQQVYQRTLQ